MVLKDVPQLAFVIFEQSSDVALFSFIKKRKSKFRVAETEHVNRPSLHQHRRLLNEGMRDTMRSEPLNYVSDGSKWCASTFYVALPRKGVVM